MANAFSLEGKAALVTGGSRGIGKDIALTLAQAGADVAIFYRQSEQHAAQAVAAMQAEGRKALAVRQDVGELETLEAAVDAVISALGRLDILVNNAGIADLAPFDQVDREMMERTLRVNVMAPFFLSQAVARRMIAAKVRGRIINITSTNAFVGEALLAPYNASKGAMQMLTQSLAIELGRHGITVNWVAPGLIQTEIGQGFPLQPEFWEYARQHIPLGELGQPGDVAGAVAFLAGDAAAYITGQHIIVDGGLLAQQFPRMQFYTGKP